MIQVKELTKIYKSRKSGTCVALDHISFTLPDKGFVFVIGKSGSGKTTLLSLLGGLDTITSGEIVENGKHVDRFGLGEQIAYRNSTIGFVFQDFHLLDELTIYENVSFALELQGQSDRDRVTKALEDTDIAEFANRYPKELSGGQKQRVAIARALVKDPTVILADEPTGNLDSKTTTQILELLKNLSREKLVVIVSHNLSDAEHYADEIIELSDGKILQHLKRNDGFDPRLRVEGGSLVIPYGEKFSDDNLNQVNTELQQKGIHAVKQDGDRFLPFQGGDECAADSAPLVKKHLKFRPRTKLAARFLRRGILRTIIYSVIFAAILTVLGLSQLIMNFNGGEVLAQEMTKRNLSCMSYIKDINDAYDSVDTTRIVDVKDNDLQKFYDAGYTGKAYPFVNYALFNVGSPVCVKQQRLLPESNPYKIKETAGVLITEPSYVEKIFGSLEYAAVCDEQKDYGIYITDFSADAFITNHKDHNKTYQSLLGASRQFTSYGYGYINGVIKTGYKDRYGELFGKLTDPALSQEELKTIAQTDEYIAFYDELIQYLNVAYSFEPDFVHKSINSGIREFVSSGISTFQFDGREYEYQETWFSCAQQKSNVPLNDNEVLMNYDFYNEVFGTAFTEQNKDDFVPHEVKFTYYLQCDQSKSQKKYETTLKIIGLNSDTDTHINLADNVLHDLQSIEHFTMGYYFDNAEQKEIVANVASGNGFLPNSAIGGSIVTMTKAVKVFSDFFVIIFVVLCAALLLLMVQFELKNIRDNMREIGIMKSLGARDVDMILIFGLQVIVAGIAMIVLYIIGSFVFIGLANKVLVLSINELAQKSMLPDISFLVVKWRYIWQNCVLASLIMAASFVVPMLRLRHIKPTNVIKAKE